MKPTLTFLLLGLFIFPLFAESSDNDLIETTGTIINIEKKRSGKRLSYVAEIKYEVDEEEYIIHSSLFAIPIMGSFKKVGDEVKLKYNINKPYIAETVQNSFLNTYGLYILIFLGILFAIPTIRNALKNKA